MTQHASDTASPQQLSHGEIAAMAHVLARRHGARAVDVAVAFAREHEEIGDVSRAGAWLRVVRELEFGAPAPTLS